MKVTYDIAVFGAGPAGMAAAHTAARKGLKTVLIEAAPKIGGVMSSCPGMMLGAGYPLGVSIGGFFEEFVQQMYKMDPPRAVILESRIPEFGPEVIYDHDVAITLLNDMLEEAGVKVLLNTRAVEVKTENDKVVGAVLAGPTGLVDLDAKMWLDCTGNGDVADAAGVPSKVGDANGNMMGATLTFFMDNVDWDKCFEHGDLYQTEAAAKGIREGRIHPSIREIYYLKAYNKNSVFFNTVTMSNVDGRDPDSIAKATQEARHRAIELAQFCKEELPGFENAYMSHMGTTVGIRETRKLEGMKCLSIQEIARETKFEDGIVACDNPIDDVFRGDAVNYSNDRALREGAYYTIPLRCLIPQKVKNLLFAGRNICADDKAFASVRGMPTCMAMGQAVAMTAKLAMDQGVDVQKVDPLEVVKCMQELGINGIGGQPLK